MGNNRRTEKGRREDLEAIEVNWPESYLGQILFPKLNRMKESGRLYYMDLVADAAAQTGRSRGTAPVTTTLTSASMTYTATELIKRYGVPFSDVDNIGGIEAADRKGGMAAKRSVMRKHEDNVVDEVLGGSADTSLTGNSDLIDAIKTGKTSIKRYKGKTAFVCASSVFDIVMKQTDVTNRLARFTSVTPMDNTQILALKKNLLAMILEVDEVLIGDDDHWNVATAGAGNDVDTTDRAAVLKLTPPEEESHEMDPVFAKTVFYLPDGNQPFVLEAHANEDEKSNKYDAQLWCDFTVFNSGALYIIDNITDPSASSS